MTSSVEKVHMTIQTHKYKHFKRNNCLLDKTEKKGAKDEIWIPVTVASATHWKGS